MTRKRCKIKMADGGNLFGDMASGAMAGSKFGPVGIAAGIGVGAITNSLNRYDQITAEKEAEQAHLDYVMNQSAQQQAMADGIPTNANNTPLMPFGGSTGRTVELEKGEPFKLPNGQMGAIPNNAPSHAQGGVTMNLPDNTKVLGKMPAFDGAKYKEIGSKIQKAQTKYQNVLKNNPTGLSARTAKRMLKNLEKDFDSLFVNQEADKGNMQNTVQMPYGGETGSNTTTKKEPTREDYLKAFGSSGREEFVYTPEQIRSSKQGDILSQQNLYAPNTRDVIGYEQIVQGRGKVNVPTVKPQGEYVGQVQPYEYTPIENNYMNFKGPDGLRKSREYYGRPRDTYREMGSEYQMTQEEMRNAKDGDVISQYRMYDKDGNVAGYERLVKGQSGKQYIKADETNTPKLANGDLISGLMAQSNVAPEGLTQDYMNSALSGFNTQSSGGGSGLLGALKAGKAVGGALNTAGTLAPTLYNLYQGSQGGTHLNAEDYYNPYTSQIQNTMQNRRYNVDPQLQANASSQATYNRALRQGAPSRAQYLAGIGMGQINRQRADAQTYATAQNMNNQYLAEQAQMDASLGQQQAQTNYGVDQFNLQSDASAQKMTGTGLTQLSQYMQNNKLMSNQQGQDDTRMNLINDFVNNYEFKDNKWVFKDTGEEVDSSTIQSLLGTLKQQ